MLMKYLVYVHEEPFALKFNTAAQVGIIGGHPKGVLEMKSVIVDYLKVEPGEERTPATNKIRIEFACTRKVFEDGIHTMIASGLRVQPAESFGRLIR